MADDVRLSLGQPLTTGSARGHDPITKLVQSDGRSIAFENAIAKGEEIAKEAKRHRATVGCGPTLKIVDPLRLHFHPVLKLVDQPRLAHAGLTNDSDDLCSPFTYQRRKGGFQTVELRFATDHARFHTLNAASGHAECVRFDLPYQVDLHRFGKAFDFYRLQRSNIEQTTNLTIGEVRDEQAAGGCG